MMAKSKMKILFPMQDGKPNLLGFEFASAKVVLDYKDCAKVMVEADDSVLANAKAASRAYFAEAWQAREVPVEG
jgi:hypothetical protein